MIIMYKNALKCDVIIRYINTVKERHKKNIFTVRQTHHSHFHVNDGVTIFSIKPLVSIYFTIFLKIATHICRYTKDM